MTLDPVTTGVFSTAVFFTLSLPAVVAMSRRRVPGLDSTFLLALVCATMASFAAFGLSISVSISWVAMMNLAYVAALACIWAMIVRLGGLALGHRLWVILALMVVVLVWTVLDPSPLVYWHGGIAYLLALAAISFLGMADVFRGSLRRRPEGIAFGALLLLHGLFFVVRSVVFLLAGPESDLFQTWLNSQITTAVSLILFVAGGNVLLRLRDEAALRVLVKQMESDPFASILPSDVFVDQVTEALEDFAPRHRPASIVHVRIDALHEIRVTFGEDAADVVGRQVVASAIEVFPRASILMRQGTAQFVWFVPDLSHRETHDAAQRLGVLVQALDVPGVPFLYGVRLTFGVAEATTLGYDVDLLLAAAQSAALRGSALTRDALAVTAREGGDPAGQEGDGRVGDGAGGRGEA